MDLQELASELNNFDTETFEVKDYIEWGGASARGP